MRCLLGLIRPTAGTARVLGADIGHLHTVIDRVGALVETPKFFPNFSGRKNLRMLAGVAGIPDTRVDEVLEIVGLGPRGRNSFHSYSLGMKQRLAVGATLLRDPEVIVLDEPANGLDPAGIVEIRVLMRDLAARGRPCW
ncbi:MAG: ATP-binding cassette domain-containing protein [Acidimicrobiales bacterium]